MARQAKVEQHGMVVVGEQHVAGFQVEVADVLLVQAVRGTPHGGAQAGDGCRVGPLGQVQPVLQGAARHVFHDQVRQALQVACSHKARHMGPGERGQDLQLHLEADDVLGAIARRHAWDFHGQRKPWVGWPHRVFHAVDMGHAARMDAFKHREAVHLGAGFEQLHRPTSRRWAK